MSYAPVRELTASQFRINWPGRGLMYTEEEIEAVADVMRHAESLTQGKYLAAFENRFEEYHGFRHCFAVATGASALELTSLLSRVGPGDEVIIPAHTYCASAIPFGRTGARLVWADIDPHTRLVSSESISSLITKRTKLIVAVHLYGLMAEMDQISEIARQNGCLVVEDCAQAIGAEHRSRKAGWYGDFAIWSFQGQKNFTTLGEGGVIRVKSEELAKLAPGLRHNGHIGFPPGRSNYWTPAMVNVDIDIDGVWPCNFSIGEAQCALGLKLLERLDDINREHLERANRVRDALRTFPEFSFQTVPAHCKHVYHLLSARYDGRAWGRTRDDFIGMMAAEFGVKCIVQYYPLYRYPLFQKMGFGEHNCPNTDEFFDSMVSLPFQVSMPEDDLQYLIDSTIRTLRRLRGEA